MPELDPNASLTQEILSYIEGFGKSAIEAVPELVGRDVSLGTARWREEHPIGGLVSEFAVPMGYYGGALKLGRLGRFGKSVERLGQNYGPFLGGAVREGARIAPFELGRVAVSSLVGDPERTALDAAIGTGISAGLGAFGGAIEAAGRRISAKWGHTDTRAPIQVQGRALAERLKDLQGPALSGAKEQLREWSLAIRESRTGARTLGELQGTKPEDARTLNRMFKFGTGPKRDVRPLARTKAGFSSDDALATTVTRARFSEGWEWYAQHPRYVALKEAGHARTMMRGIARGMTKIGDDTWIAKEKDGLFLMARRLAPEAAPAAPTAAKSEWVLWKTDEPARFASIGEGAWKTKVENWSAWLSTEERSRAALAAHSSTLSFASKVLDELPLRTDLPSKQGIGSTALKGLAKFYGYGEKGELAEGFQRFAREYMAPARHRFVKNALANQGAGLAKILYDRAQQQASKIMMGEVALAPGKSALGTIARGIPPKGGLRQLVEQLDENDLRDVWKVWRDRLALDAPEAASITPRSRELLESVSKIDPKLIAEVNATEKAVGASKTKFLENHYLLSHVWEGDHRVPVLDGTKLVALGGGTTRAGALGHAERLIEAGRGQGRELSMGMPYVREWDGRSLNLEHALLKPSFYNERRGVGGYVGESSPLNRDQLMEALSSHVQRIQRYLAHLGTQQTLQKHLVQLDESDAGIARQLREYLGDLAGVQGPVAQVVNKAVDAVLAPVLGTNSATKVVQGTNNFFYHTQLGGFNLSFPVMNLLTFAQTVVPELAFVAHGAPERVSKYYTHWLLGDGAQRPARVLGALDAWKLQGQAFRALKAPDAGLAEGLSRAMNEGTLDPRMLEEFVGPQASARQPFMEALKSPGGFVKWLGRASSWLPEVSERLGRAQAFTAAHLFGRDFLGLGANPDRLYSFAKQFTDRTMFLYHTSDRPKVLQGPLGSAFGLFKNWQFNYLWNLFDYMGEAAQGNLKPLLWGFTGSGLVGGLPATGMLWAGADAMSEWMNDRSLLEEWYGAFPRDPDGVNMSDALFLGLPGFLPTLAGLPGVALTGQAATPLSDPTRDISQLMSFTYLDRMKFLGSAVGTAVEAWDNGLNPFENKAFVGELARALAPKAIYRVQQSLTEGVITSSTSQYPQMDLPPLEKILYTAGFNPSRMELGYRSHAALWKDEEARKAAVASVGEAWAQAQLSRNYDEIQRLMRRVIVEKMDMDSVMRSVRTRLGNAQEDMFERSFSAKRLAELRRSGLYDR